MTTLVMGASGATGRLLTAQLADGGHKVRIIVRSPDTLPESLLNHNNVSVIKASILDLSDAELNKHVSGCDAVASCLGHNISMKGLFGHPRRLVTDAVQRLCVAIKLTTPENPVRVVLMNTTGNRNRDLSEAVSFGEKSVIWLLRHLLPPQADNEQAAEFLRTDIGQNDSDIGWVAVRPDGLIDAEEVTEYEVYQSPIRSAIFDAGKTSRINVGHFMAQLMTDSDIWNKWKGQMPVIYNKTS